MSSPARNVEMRVRARDSLTSIIVWPIIAHPHMPPKKLVTMFCHALAPGLARLVGVGVGDLIEVVRRPCPSAPWASAVRLPVSTSDLRPRSGPERLRGRG